MSRRRYLSTDISKDARVRRLAQDAGEFAALVYTWMIPHATDDGTLPDNAEELLMLIVPGFGWRTPEEMQTAIEAMLRLGLLEQQAERLRFPPAAFFRYQSYVTAERRTSAQISAQPRESAQNSASFKSSSSFKSGLSSAPSGGYDARARARDKFFCQACETELPKKHPLPLCDDCHARALMHAHAEHFNPTTLGDDDLVRLARDSA